MTRGRFLLVWGILALGALGIAHSTWLDYEMGVLGVSLEATSSHAAWTIASVDPNGPGAAAGLSANEPVWEVADRWGRVARPGQGRTMTAMLLALRPGEILRLRVGPEEARREVAVTAARPREIERGPMAWITPLVGLAVRLLYFGVGAALILLRPRDPRSLLLGMFCIAVPQASLPTLGMLHGLREAIWFLAIARNALIFTAIAHFALLFPEPIARPRTQRTLLAVLYGAFLPVFFSHVFFVSAAAFGAPDLVEAGGLARTSRNYTLGYLAAAWLAAALLLVVQDRRAASVDAKRRLRVVLLGFGATFLVCLLVGLSIFFFATAGGAARLASSRLLELGLLTVLAIFPLTVAWAVVRHRMFDVRVIVRRGLRYALARRVLLSVLAVPLVAFVYTLGGSTAADLASVRVFAMVPLAALLVGAAFYRERILNRLDRSFFREAYDARRVLLGLADRVRLARDPEVLAHDLERSASEALHPAFARLHVADERGVLRAPGDGAPLPPEVPSLLADVGRGLVLDADSRRARALPPPSLALLRSTGAELLAPVRGRDGGLFAVLALGPKRSGEPYLREDLDLVATAGRQYAAAIENLRLEREVRDTREAEQRLRGEIEMAREVQARLLPHRPPAIPGGDVHGVCRPARVVGGDYYDFISMPAGRIGLAVADVSGKGLAAAMLMSNLQAGLRTAVSAGVGIGGALRAVNALLCELTSDNRFASFFFGVYDPADGTLHYLNAGHNAPLIVRCDLGTTEALQPTAPILGVLTDWNGSERRVALAPGDVLVVYTDGLSESTDAAEIEFGDAGVARSITAAAGDGATAESIAGILLAAVDVHAGGRPPADDLTLVVLRRARPAGVRA